MARARNEPLPASVFKALALKLALKRRVGNMGTAQDIKRLLQMPRADRERGITGRLPVVKICRTYYFVDEYLQELRNVRNPFDRESIELAHAPAYAERWM